MTSWKTHVENRIGHLGEWIFHHPKTAILAVFLFVGLFASFLRLIHVDNNLDSFIDKSEPSRVAYEKVKEDYGRSDSILFVFTPENVTSLEFLNDLKSIHERFEAELPYLDEVTSLINVRKTLGNKDGLEVGELMDPFPVNEAELQTIVEAINTNPLYKGLIIDDEKTLTALIVTPLTYDPDKIEDSELDRNGDDSMDDEFDSAFDSAFESDFDSQLDGELDSEFENESNIVDPELTKEEQALPNLPDDKVAILYLKALNILKDYPHLEVYKGGIPVVNGELNYMMQSEMSTFMSLTILLIFIVLTLFFKRVVTTLAPLVGVILALIVTFGTLALAGQPFQLPLIMVPSFLIAVTIGDAVHLMSHYFQHFDQGEEKKTALINGMRKTGIPMLLTSLTTAAGLASLAGGDLVPIRNLGIFAALGVLLAFAFTMVLIPAMLTLAKTKPRIEKGVEIENSPLTKFLHLSCDFALRHMKPISAVWLITLFAALYSASDLRFSHYMLGWFPDYFQVKKSVLKIDDKLGGSVNIDVVIDTGRTDGIKDPQLLKDIETLIQYYNEFEGDGFRLGKITSINDIVKETHKALNEGQEKYYDIPESKPLLSQELVLFENAGQDEIEGFVDSRFSQTKITIMAPMIDILKFGTLVEDMETHFQEVIGDRATVKVSGLLSVMSETLTKVMEATAISYGIAAITISIMMMLLLSSVRYGLLAMVPNLVPIAIVMGIMPIVGVPLDMFTMLVATIAIGITVDNTVHFMHHFKHHYEETGELVDSIHYAYQIAGRAIFMTAIILTAGFYVFLFSDVGSIFSFGVLAGTTFLLATASNFLLTPALLVMFSKKNQNSNDKTTKQENPTHG